MSYCTYTCPIGGKYKFNQEGDYANGQLVSANVVVIQKDNNRITYKIVTVYPDKKGN